MQGMNRLFLLGNLTQDPELKYTPSGTALTKMRVAVNRRYKSSDGESKDEVMFIDVDVWGRQGEACGEHLHKGSAVLIEGRLKYNQWTKDGKTFSNHTAVADRVTFIAAKRGGGGGHGGQPDDEVSIL